MPDPGWQGVSLTHHRLLAIPDLEPVNLIEAIGRCPPEDVGGPGGYQEFLEAIAGPEH
ncbi:plasmid pRiA4b ORF-3 family protein [Paraburkholderia aspalathi]|nr:plasmid pRiA4b ORF-3 family protein [Paraburkholderia aspalathi]